VYVHSLFLLRPIKVSIASVEGIVWLYNIDCAPFTCVLTALCSLLSTLCTLLCPLAAFLLFTLYSLLSALLLSALCSLLSGSVSFYGSRKPLFTGVNCNSMDSTQQVVQKTGQWGGPRRLRGFQTRCWAKWR
jgi:hypothetical protein